MKKILLCVPLLAIFAAGFFGCSQQRQWNHEQRKAMREALRSYRQMVYLDDLTDAPNFGTKFGRRRPCPRYGGPNPRPS